MKVVLKALLCSALALSATAAAPAFAKDEKKPSAPKKAKPPKKDPKKDAKAAEGPGKCVDAAVPTIEQQHDGEQITTKAACDADGGKWIPAAK